MPVELVMPSNHLTHCHPLLLLPSVFPKHQGLFQSVDTLHQVAKVLELQLKNERQLLKETEGSNLFVEVQRLRLESMQLETKISAWTLRISS